MLPNIEKVANEAGVPLEVIDLDGTIDPDVIILITSAFSACLMAQRVSAETHIARIGSDTKGKQENEVKFLKQATVFTDEFEQSISIGEAQHADG